MNTPVGNYEQTLRPLIDLVARELPKLPAAERADVYDAVAFVSRDVMPAISEAAHNAAEALRDAEACQLTFTSLLQAAAVL